MLKITSMPVGQVNRIIEELFNRRSKFDSRGRIDTRQVFKAIRASYSCIGKLEEDTLKGAINFMVACNYLRFEKDGSYIRFFLNFSDVVKENGKVIGVRW